jgi:hypothetical protein
VDGRFTCPRCKVKIESQEALNNHLLWPKICDIRENGQDDASDEDPEDGISPEVFHLLNERKQNSKVDTWRALWNKLFPRDVRCQPQVRDVTPAGSPDHSRQLTLYVQISSLWWS